MKLFLTINRFNRLYLNALNEQLRPFDLSAANWALLNFLNNHEYSTTNEIATLWQVEKPTVSTNVKSMMTRGYISAITGEDKREKKLMLTDTGKQLWQQVSPIVVALQQKIIQEPQQQGLYEQLESALDLMEETLRGMKHE